MWQQRAYESDERAKISKEERDVARQALEQAQHDATQWRNEFNTRINASATSSSTATTSLSSTSSKAMQDAVAAKERKLREAVAKAEERERLYKERAREEVLPSFFFFFRSK